jgi:hypothetical protein
MDLKLIHLTCKVAIVVFILIISTSINMATVTENLYLLQQDIKRVELVSSAVKSTFSAGEDIEIDLSLRNPTSEVVYYLYSMPEKNYRIDVRKETGESVRLTEHGEFLTNLSGDGPMLVIMELQPGESIQHKITINEIFDLSSKGTYLVSVKRGVFNKQKGTFIDIVSDIIKLEIVD